MNKKGQVDYPLIAFIVIVFALLLLGPIMLKVFHDIQTPLASSLGNVTNGKEGAQNVNLILNTASTFWDKVIIAVFIFSCILLIISAFLIDTSPFWVILYIVISLFVIIFSPSIIGALDTIYTSATYATEVNQLTFTGTLRDHFAEFLVGLMVITGIIIYGKIRFGNRSSGYA